jgi:hypothetical protein
MLRGNWLGRVVKKWRERVGAEASVLGCRVSGSRVRLSLSPVGSHHLPAARLPNFGTRQLPAVGSLTAIMTSSSVLPLATMEQRLNGSIRNNAGNGPIFGM